MKDKIKVLWIVNILFPYPAKEIGMNKTNFGGWMKALMEDLEKNNNIELAIATKYNGKEFLDIFDESANVKYYLIPGKINRKIDKNSFEYWKMVTKLFEPDIVHINGTEYSMGLEFQNACPEIKSVVSIQGLLKPYGDVYYANISFKEILHNLTFQEILRKRTIFDGKRDFLKGAKNEIMSIQKANAITGRTIWDYSYSKAINDKAKYYYCARTLRKSFYETPKWNIENIQRHTIFCSQGTYPIKGIHYMIQALEIVKRRYNDVQLFIAGKNLMKTKENKDRVKYSGYAKYVRKLIRKCNLENNVNFVGELDEKGMIDYLLKSNVYVQPSAIENSPNSLGEAMLLGVPCIASHVGGTSDMLTHKKEGLLYTYTDYPVLAEYINEIFASDSKAIKYSNNSIKEASITHNREENYKNTVDMYKDMMI